MVTESGLKRNLSYLWPRRHIVLRYGMREVGHMQTGKRVYPRQREPGKWLSYLLLFLSAVVVISVPLIVLFLLFRNKVMEGVSRGGTKG